MGNALGWWRSAGLPWRALGVLAIGALAECVAIGMARQGFGLLLPTMRADLDVSYAAMGSIATASFLGHMASAFLSGAIAVRLGMRPVLVTALALTGLATIATSASSSVVTAGLSQLVVGIGTGGTVVAANGLVAAWFSRPRRGLATGISVGGSGVGMLSAGLALPMVLAAGPGAWRSGWVVLGVPSLVAAALAFLVVREVPRERGARPADRSAAAPGAEPLLTRAAVYRQPALWWLAALCALWAAAQITFITFFAAAGVSSGLDAVGVGQLWVAVGGLSSLSCVVWGFVSDRLGRMRTLTVVFVLQGSACVALGMAAGPAWFLGAAVLFGAGGAATPALANATAADIVGPRLTPAAIGMLGPAFGLGLGIGPPVAGLLRDATGSFTAPSLAAAGVLALAALLALLGRRAGVVGR